MGESVDYLHCSSDPASLDGVLFCGKKAAVVDGTPPHIIEPEAPGAIGEYVNLGVLWDSQKLMLKREEILQLCRLKQSRYDALYQQLGAAKEIHDRWEKLYGECTDYAALNRFTEDFLEGLLGKLPEKPEQGILSHRFFGALTPDGSVHYLEELTEDSKTRYFIKGRPGTGKSTLLKKLMRLAEKKGLMVQVYHCSFDSESLDLVILPELSLSIFDATPPHEIFPCREGDVILDLYEAAVRPGTDQEHHELLSLFAREYGERMKTAKQLLGEIRELHGELEDIYAAAMDFSDMDEIYQSLKQEIAEL